MPPYSNMRKASLASIPPLPIDVPSQQRRTTSGRAVRANTTRPTNYYARPFTIMAPDETDEVIPPIGFYPAITFFADAIDALPKDIVRQFTLMKEVEAKVHGPAEQLGSMCEELMEAPVPRRKGGQLAAAAMMMFTAPNSNAGSANASVINGTAPALPHYGQDSAAGSIAGDETQDTDEGFARRHKFGELRNLAMSLIPNMEEKNALLAESIRVMDAQLSRIDGVMPHVENEIPEEARLGSMTHWAYTGNRKKAKATAQVSRREIGATNTLAAAASAMHDADIAMTRRETGKVGRGRNRDNDSEFEERPRKPAKLNSKGRSAQPAGLGITNGELVKRRKVEKTVNNVPGMERQVSNAGRGTTKVKSAAVEELARKSKNTKPLPTSAKRRAGNSAHASPALASSPLALNGPLSNAEATTKQSARNRQNSTASNLRHERLAEDSTSRPSSAAGKSNGERSNPRLKRQREDTEGDESADRVDGERNVTKVTENERGRPVPSRSNSSNKTPSGRGSKVGTPKEDSISAEGASMARSRSTRATKPNESTSEPQTKGHRRGGGVGSVSGLMKQIAPFNRSPDLDRHRKSDSDNSSVSDPADDLSNAIQSTERRQSEQQSRPGSSLRRNVSEGGDVQAQLEREQYEEAQRNHHDGQDEDMPDGPDAVPGLITDNGEDNDDDDNVPGEGVSPSLTPEAVSQRAVSEQLEEYEDNDVTLEDAGIEAGDEEEIDADEDEAEDEDPDPDDPNEPKYCYCMRGSYGDMVGCDNPKCPREWFHLGCTDLTKMPSEEESWFCNFCRPSKTAATNGRRGAARGKGRA